MRNVLIISKAPVRCPVIQYGITNSDEVPVPQPPGSYPDNIDNIPIYGLKDLMFTSVYDTNNDGVVDKSESTPWTGVTDPPDRFPSTIPLVDDLEERLESIAGGGGSAYTFTQTTPSAVWTIHHNLGFKPSVELFDSDGNLFDASVMQIDQNTMVVTMNVPMTGYARLN